MRLIAFILIRMGLQNTEQIYRKIVCGQTQQQQRLLYKRISFFFIISFVSIRLIADFWIRAVPGAYRNTGTAFSIPIFGYAVYGIVIAGILIFSKKSQYMFPATLMFAAGASNMFERIRYGAVIDPIVVLNWHGNIADIALGMGILWLMWGMIMKKDI